VIDPFRAPRRGAPTISDPEDDNVKVTMCAMLLFGLGAPACALAGCGDSSGPSTDAATDEGADSVQVKYETCAPCPSPPTCRSGEVLSCCACVKKPGSDAARTSCSDMSDYCGTGGIDVSCLKPGGYPAAGEVRRVTARGVVDVYATGPGSAGVTVAFYEEGADGALGDLVGTTVSTDDCAAHEADLPAPHEVGDEAEFCPGVCRELLPDTEDCRTLAYYSVDNVPTGTPLIVKTSGSSATWKDMYSYNIWFFAGEVQDGKVFYRARCLSLDDWRNIPVAAGDTSGIAPGKGGVAGEIHDCGDVRVYYATVATNPVAMTFTYFNGVEEKLYPDLSRASYGTNLDGLYAAMEIDGDRAVTVTALAQVPGEGLVSLGWRTVRTFPDALTAVTLKGTRPDQVPAD